MTKIHENTFSDILKQLFTPNPEILNTPPSSDNSTVGGKNMLRILFLDVDGVLNSHKTQILYGNTPFPGFDSGNGFVDHAECTDLMAAALVNKLCESTGAVIVVSSSWRIGSNLTQVQTMMEALGIDPDLIIGKTHTTGRVRGLQIHSFLDNMKTEEGRATLVKQGHLLEDIVFEEDVLVQSYVIIDDDSDMLESQRDHFVQTTFMEGLTCALTIKAGQILSEDVTFHLNQLAGFASAGDEWERTMK